RCIPHQRISLGLLRSVRRGCRGQLSHDLPVLRCVPRQHLLDFPHRLPNQTVGVFARADIKARAPCSVPLNHDTLRKQTLRQRFECQNKTTTTSRPLAQARCARRSGGSGGCLLRSWGWWSYFRCLVQSAGRSSSSPEMCSKGTPALSTSSCCSP